MGPLQPILHRVERAIRDAALADPAERDDRLESEIRSLEDEIDRAKLGGLDLDDLVEIAPAASPDLPARWEEVESFLIGSVAVGYRFRPNPDPPGTWRLTHRGVDHVVTFAPTVADEHPDSVRFMTLGDPLLVDTLAGFPVPEDGHRVLRAAAEGPGRPLVGWYVPSGDGAREVKTLTDLRDGLSSIPQVDAGSWQDDALQRFGLDLGDRLDAEHRGRVRRAEERHSAVVERGRMLLARATYLWVARSGLAGSSITETTVRSLVAQGYPWGPLSEQVEDLPQVGTDDPAWLAVADKSRAQLDGLWAAVLEGGDRTLREILRSRETLSAEAEPPTRPMVVSSTFATS